MTVDGWLYLAAVLLALLLVPGAITLLKGHVAAFVLGLFTLAMVWTVTAFRLAKPGSWWARRFYDEEKLERAQARYG